jgi:hypothetical protein
MTAAFIYDRPNQNMGKTVKPTPQTTANPRTYCPVAPAHILIPFAKYACNLSDKS